MSRSNIGGTATDYVLNAQGQRVAKVNKNINSRYFYAGQNQLMTELNNGMWTNYFWLEGELVGLARNGQHNYVHTDHLGRPEFVTSPSQQTVWKAYNYAYGRSVQKDEIGGLNIGFPASTTTRKAASGTTASATMTRALAGMCRVIRLDWRGTEYLRVR